MNLDGETSLFIWIIWLDTIFWGFGHGSNVQDLDFISFSISQRTQFC